MNQDIPQFDEKAETDNIVNELESYWQRYFSLFRNNKKYHIFVAVIATGVLLGGLAYFFKYYQQSQKKVVVVPELETGSTSAGETTGVKEFETPPEYQMPDTSSIEEDLLSGEIKRIDEDLELFVPDLGQNKDIVVSPIYYEAGFFVDGPLKGYKRIVGVATPYTPWGALTFVFATNDGKQYITEKNDDKYINEEINTNKVSFVESLSSQHPQTIALDDVFVLYRKSISTTSIDSTVTNHSGRNMYRYVLDDQFLDMKELESNDPYLKFMSKDYVSRDYSQGDIDGQDVLEIEGEYFDSLTNVRVMDKTGLVYIYDLTTKEDLQRYFREKKQYDVDHKKYENEYEDYLAKIKQGINSDELSYPQSPDQVQVPSLSFANTNASYNMEEDLFDSYKTAFPAACGVGNVTYAIKNINEDDLMRIGTNEMGDVWKLKDPDHPLLKLAYKIKVEDAYDDWFLEINNMERKPTFEEYVAQNPLLIIKDHWGRYVVVGEWDYIMEGGCGKPVIYLYPEEETKVSVRFLSNIDITTDIPDYDGEWYVLAQPDGTLQNLKKNDCSDDDFEKFGSEYALEACQKNEYPYLYWAGNSLGHTYQSIREGWIIPRDELEQFLEQKLLEVGLTQGEMEDMVSYWIPEMLSTESSYFKVGFLQNKEMNELVPMQITPTPDSIFRIFLDWYPLADMPDQLPEPQKLDHVQRRGFTVIEWGGLHP